MAECEARASRRLEREARCVSLGLDVGRTRASGDDCDLRRVLRRFDVEKGVESTDLFQVALLGAHGE